MSEFSALIQPPDPVDAISARAVCRTERVPAGEFALRQAMLLDAINLLETGAERIARNDPRDWGTAWRHEYAEARRWVASRDRGQPFAFELVCEVLGLDAGRVRSRVLAAAPEIDTPASHLELVSPRTIAAHERLATRVWRWAEEQTAPWTVLEAATAARTTTDSIRGLVSYWRKTGRLEKFRDQTSRNPGLYRVTR